MMHFLLAAMMATQPADSEPTDWVAQGEATLEARLAEQPIIGEAKNVILFVADGMDVTTITAGRIYAGQREGNSGEEHVLAFETMPYVALAKTYNTNMQTPDSAGTATAMMTGHKTLAGVINIGQSVARGDCEGSLSQQLPTIMDVAQAEERRVGIISSARITHATPATVYAHAPDRGWESDGDLPASAAGCTDIATQLIEAAATYPIDVVLGGGRSNFLPAGTVDPEYPQRTGNRADSVDLTAAWSALAPSNSFVWNTEQFNALPARGDGAVLGLFEPSHMRYEADRDDDAAGEPSLAEMTSFAIERLSQSDEGFFLLVEGGRIDHAHHAGNAARALEDVVAFDAAVEAALTMTAAEDTLIIVTADHGHTMAIQGYAHRGNPILGVVSGVDRAGAPNSTPYPAADGRPYTTLAYTNGPGSPFARSTTGTTRVERPFVNNDEAQDIDYRQQSAIPSVSETHGGQDVAVFARGPMAHLVGGVVEQNYIYYVMREAMSHNAE